MYGMKSHLLKYFFVVLTAALIRKKDVYPQGSREASDRTVNRC